MIRVLQKKCIYVQFECSTEWIYVAYGIRGTQNYFFFTFSAHFIFAYLKYLSKLKSIMHQKNCLGYKNCTCMTIKKTPMSFESVKLEQGIDWRLNLKTEIEFKPALEKK